MQIFERKRAFTWRSCWSCCDRSMASQVNVRCRYKSAEFRDKSEFSVGFDFTLLEFWVTTPCQTFSVSRLAETWKFLSNSYSWSPFPMCVFILVLNSWTNCGKLIVASNIFNPCPYKAAGTLHNLLTSTPHSFTLHCNSLTSESTHAINMPISLINQQPSFHLYSDLVLIPIIPQIWVLA